MLLDFVRVSFRVERSQNTLSYTCSSDLSQPAKDRIHSFMHSPIEDFDLFLHRFGGSLTIEGPLRNIQTVTIEKIIKYYFKMLHHLSDKTAHLKARQKLESACQASEVKITWIS